MKKQQPEPHALPSRIRFLHKAALPRKIMPHATCISNLYFYLCLRRVKQRGAPGKAGLRLYPHQYKEDLMQVMLP